MAAAGSRSIVIHGHFYQPPRENPWIEEIEVQDSAAPRHDWNERIAIECYGPNSAARIVDRSTGGIIDILNNYSKISFNVGPTLLSDLERRFPAIYRKILEADRVSAAERGGHGNAIAQVYSHMILPLANARDRVTQVRWGLADFRRRFGRDAEGMWLAECAVDEATLCTLVDEGVKFTILAQRQARRTKAPGMAAWPAVDNGADPRRPYRVELPGGRSIAVFFFDNAVAQDISFGATLADRDAFVNRLLAAFGEADAAKDWLVNVATDGETFGHHRAFGDMVLAAAVERLEREQPARLTNYGEYLALHPPDHVAEVIYPSSWSCAHGVARWEGDCGCNTSSRPGWNQKWRRPLRDALDLVRDALAEIFERRGRAIFGGDPWAVRDRYVEVILDRGKENVDAFLASANVKPEDGVAALELLEMQRHAMLMYTSCAWFFSELSGVETVQNLRYALRAIQLARSLGEPDAGDLEPAFTAALSKAQSNLPEQGTGAQIVQRARRAEVSAAGVVAHFAMRTLLEDLPASGRLLCWRYETRDLGRRSRGPTTMLIGRVALESELTGEARDARFVLLHFGVQDMKCVVAPVGDIPSYETMKRELVGLFEHKSIGDVVRAVDAHYAPEREFGLSDLYLDARRSLVRVLVGEVLARQAPQALALFEENQPLLRFLIDADIPVPPLLRASADAALSARWVTLAEEAVVGADGWDATVAALRELVVLAKALGATLDVLAARTIMEARILAEARALRVTPRVETARSLLAYLALADELALKPELWEAQNLYWTLTLEGPRGPDANAEIMFELGTKLGFARSALEPTDLALRRRVK